jgi:hypothetical protein
MAMADIGMINLKMSRWWRSMVVAPSREKIQAQAISVDASSTPAKHRHGRPLGSKNKVKTSVVPTSADEHLDVSLAQPVLLQSSARNLFSFFAFVGAQCNEPQLLPLKFTEFVEGRELREAILREVSSDGQSYEVEVYYDDNGDTFF